MNVSESNKYYNMLQKEIAEKKEELNFINETIDLRKQSIVDVDSTDDGSQQYKKQFLDLKSDFDELYETYTELKEVAEKLIMCE